MSTGLVSSLETARTVILHAVARGSIWAVLVALPPRADAGVTLDGTLGPRGALQGPNYQITADKGRQVGGNLFHSFGQFSIDRGEVATFSGPDTIDNVVGRVTGGDPSLIDGTIRSMIPEANLFLINPRGVVFGPNARLEVDGSFAASTADYLRLGDGGLFDARHPEASTLTVAPPSAFGFLGERPAPIAVDGATLEVADGRDLSLVGGDVTVTGGVVRTPGGRIDVVSAGSAGEVAIGDQGRMELQNQNGSLKGAVTITAGASLDASAASGGTVSIRAGRLVVNEDAEIRSDTIGDSDGAATAIDIEVGESLQVTDASIVSVTVGSGRGGSIQIEAGDVDVSGPNAVVLTGSVDTGAAGDVLIHTPTVSMRDGSISSEALGEGDGGDIALNVGRLSLRDGAQVVTSTKTGGVAGNVSVVAAEEVLISGRSAPFNSGIFSGGGTLGSSGNVTIVAPRVTLSDHGTVVTLGSGGGRAGDVLIEVNTLTLSGSAELGSKKESVGSGGDVRVNATESVTIVGRGDPLTDVTRLISSGNNGASAGDILVRTPSLFVDGGVITGAAAFGGKAGDVIIEVEALRLVDGGAVDSSAVGGAQAGTVRIRADESIFVSGRDGPRQSGISTFTNGTGAAGFVSISTPTLTLDDAVITAGSLAEGRAGDVMIEVGRLTMQGGAQLGSTRGTALAGNVTVVASESISISGARGDSRSGIFNISLGDVAGSAGRIVVSTPTLVLDDGGTISASTSNRARAGDIVVHVGDVTLTHGASIETSAQASGGGGTVTVSATDTIRIAGDSRISSASTATGVAGDIDVRTRQLELTDGGAITAESSGPSDAGSIRIATGSLRSEHGSITTAAAEAEGGNITIAAEDIVLARGSPISATVSGGEGGGGNILLETDTLVVFDTSGIQANAEAGPGGNVTVRAEALLTSPDAQLSASSRLGVQGTVELNTPEVNLSGVLDALPQEFLGAIALLAERCAALREGQFSTFVIGSSESIPAAPDAVLRGPALPLAGCL